MPALPAYARLLVTVRTAFVISGCGILLHIEGRDLRVPDVDQHTPAGGPELPQSHIQPALRAAAFEEVAQRLLVMDAAGNARHAGDITEHDCEMLRLVEWRRV